jgi:CRISPR system Cascade subunit CasB
MNGFISWLEKASATDTKVRAVLRRSLAFTPGSYAPAFPYVEPFLPNETSARFRAACYLTAGLWALHKREGSRGAPLTIGAACRAYRDQTGSGSVEQRFINLLDAAEDQLPNRLRHIIALLKDQCINFDDLLHGLLNWEADDRRIQQQWARDFYRHTASNHTTESSTATEEQA